MGDDFSGCCDVALVEIFRRILPSNFHGQFDFRVDVDAVKDTLAEGKLSRKANGIAREDEPFTHVAGERVADVLKHGRDHQVVDLIRAEVELDAVAVSPNLDVAAGDTGQHGVERVVKVLHLESRFDVLSVKSNDAPVDSNGDVKDEVGFERVDEGRAVHGQHGRCHVFIFDDFDVGAVGPSGLVAWEVPDGHVVSGLVQVDLEEVHVSPTVVVAGFQNEVVGVPGVHGLVPRAVPLKFV